MRMFEGKFGENLLVAGFGSLVFLAATVGWAAHENSARASEVLTGGSCGRIYRGGGEVPVPFDAVNQRVELADGEYYGLVGQLVASGSDVWLQIDLDVHPWLATQYRIKHPYYLILNTDPSKLKGLTGRRVLVTGQAQGKLTYDALGIASFSLAVAPGQDGVVAYPDY